MSLIELTLALMVVGLVFPALGGIYYQVLAIAPKQADKMQASLGLQNASLWLTRDTESADDFLALGTPQYGQFTWTDYTGAAPVVFIARYSLDGRDLVRTFLRDGVVQSQLVVAGEIAAYGDVSFTWSPSARTVQVSIVASPQARGATDVTLLSTSVVANLFPRNAPSVAPPQANPQPPPPPGSVTYLVNAAPTVLTGTYASGNAASLTSIDGTFYAVNSTTTGPTKTAAWEVASQTISEPSAISQVEVRLTNQASAGNVAVSVFVKSSGVYGTNPDALFAYPASDTSVTQSVYLTAAQITYVNSVRSVTVKVVATNPPAFSLSADQLIFIVSP